MNYSKRFKKKPFVPILKPFSKDFIISTRRPLRWKVKIMLVRHANRVKFKWSSGKKSSVVRVSLFLVSQLRLRRLKPIIMKHFCWLYNYFLVWASSKMRFHRSLFCDIINQFDTSISMCVSNQHLDDSLDSSRTMAFYSVLRESIISTNHFNSFDPRSTGLTDPATE